MKFSQRIGETPSRKSMQLRSMDRDLKNQLWNIIYGYIILNLKNHDNENSYGRGNAENYFINSMWHHFFKLKIDEVPTYPVPELKNRYENFHWFEVYDLLEFCLEHDYLDNCIPINEFIQECNKILEAEFSAYRISQGKITPITSEIELEEIDNALLVDRNIDGLEGVSIHIEKSLDKISDRKNPDYRNSIKEAISGVETIIRVLTGERTLGKGLKSLEKKGIKIDQQLKSSFEKLYSFSNGENGIRHALIKPDKSPTFEDAKYMLVTCSAFINYLSGKVAMNMNKVSQ
jgi:hypothetical protein